MHGEQRDDTGANLLVYACDGFSGPTRDGIDWEAHGVGPSGDAPGAGSTAYGWG